MSKQSYPPVLIVISAPSGAGKTTICHKLLERNPDFRLSISATTRPPRHSEQNGVDYFFLTEQEFREKVSHGEFLEYEKVFDHYYGTLGKTVEDYLHQGHSILFDIDVNGALRIKQNYPTALLIFIRPPSLAELKTRLRNRKTDDPEEIEKRLKRLPEEYAKADFFDYVVVNDDLDRTVEKIEKIIRNYQRQLSHVSQ